MIILGMDPGKASGWTVYDMDNLEVLDMRQSENGVEGFADEYEEIVSDIIGTGNHIDAMVMETFTLRPGVKFPDLTPVECWGWMKGQGNASKLVRCAPSAHKSLVSDANIRQSGLMKDYKVGAGHSRDALRLALWFSMSKMKHTPTIRLVKGM